MDTSSDSLSPVELLAEEFLDRQQRGENPTIEEYCQQHPDLADEIRDVFEGFLLIEDLKPGSHDVSEAFTGDRQLDGRKLDRVGDYRIIREIGRGGMGVVYEAEQESLRRRVALKVLPKQHAVDENSLLRFQREARAAARMHHTNIVPVFEVGQSEDWVFYAMQLIQGQGLDLVIDDLKRIRSEHSLLKSRTKIKTDESEPAPRSIAASLVVGRFEQEKLIEEQAAVDGAIAANVVTSDSEALRAYAETIVQDGGSTVSAVLPGHSEISTAETNRHGYFQSVAQIGLQTARALSYAHARGIIHRDIKPSNLLLDAAGIVWVTDFGLAKTSDEAMTHTGDILGTIRYMSPERFRGQCDNRADVYSLGLTLYEMLVLKPAYSSPDRLRLIELVTKTEPELPRSLDPKIPRDLETIILKCIDKDARRRYQSADELAEDLQRFVEDEPIKARRISLFERSARWARRRKALAASLAVVCTLLLIINIVGPLMYLRMAGLKQDAEARKQEVEQTNQQLQESQQREKQRADDMQDLADQRDRAAQTALLARDEARRLKELSRQSEYRSTLFAAQHALTSIDGYTRGKELLDGLRPQSGEQDLRGIEFHLLNSLPNLSGGRILRTDLPGYRDDISFSPDGRYVVSADNSSKAIVVIDVATGEIIKRLTGHRDSVRQVQWKSNGKELISCGFNSDQTIRVWDVERGIPLKEIPGGRSFALSPDETRVVYGKDPGLVEIRHLLSGELLESFDKHEGRIHRVDWSVRNQIASCGRDGKVHLWDLTTSQEHLLIDGSEGDSTEWVSVQFNPDGSRLAAGTYQAVAEPVVIWDVEHPEQKRSLPVGRSVSRGMPTFTWSHDGTRLAGGIWPGAAIEVWDAAAGQLVRRFDGLPDGVRTCSWSPDDRELASRTWKGVVQVWKVEEHEPNEEFDGPRAPVHELTWSPDGRHFATASTDGAIRIWDTRSQRVLHEFKGHPREVRGVEWHPQENRLVSCDIRSVLIWEWDGANSNVKQVVSRSGSGFQDVAWSPDGTQIATAQRARSGNGFVRTYDYDAGTGTLTKSREFDRIGAGSLSWEQNGTGAAFLAAARRFGEKSTLIVWNSETWEEVFSAEFDMDRNTRICLSPQADRVAIAAQSQEDALGEAAVQQQILKIVDLETERELHLRGHAGDVQSLSWSADGTRLLTAGGNDGTCSIWDAVTGRQLVTFESRGVEDVQTAQFSPDDLQVAMAGGGLELLDAAPSYTAILSQRVLPRLAERINARPSFADLVLRARIQAREGNWAEAAADFEKAAQMRTLEVGGTSWFETAWWLAGPYSEPLGDAQPPESQLDPLQPIPAADSQGESTQWRVIGVSDALDLGAHLAEAEHVSAYVQTRIYATEGQTAGLLLGADDQVRVWSNAREVYTRTRNREAVRDDEVVEIGLQPGWNTLLIKVTNVTGPHGLFARLSDNPRELAEAFTRNAQWEQAVTWWERAAAIQPHDDELLISWAGAALGAGRRELARDLFDQVLEGDGSDSIRWRIAEQYLEDAHGRSAGAEESLDQSRKLFEQLLRTDDSNLAAVSGLTDVLLAQSALEMKSTWHILQPVEIASQGGTTLTKLVDNSVLAGGAHPDHDLYTVTAATNLSKISAIRVEALMDNSLPNGGPGRASSGRFVMDKFRVNVATRKNPAHAVPVHLNAATADFYLPSRPITPDGPWHVAPGPGPDLGKPHVAVYQLTEPIQSSEGSQLTFEMTFHHGPGWPGLNLGRFRLSVTDDQDAFEVSKRIFVVTRIEDPWEQLAAAYRLRGMDAELEALLVRRPQAALGIAQYLAAAGHHEDAIDTLSQMESLTDNQTFHDLRGRLNVRLARWHEAAMDYKYVLELKANADSGEWVKAVALHAMAVIDGSDTIDDYEQICRAMVDQFQSSQNKRDIERTIKCCALLPAQTDISLLPTDRVTDALADGTAGESFGVWGHIAAALFEYRRGEFEAAEEFAVRAEERSGSLQSGQDRNLIRATAGAVRTLAQVATGQRDEARKTVNTAREHLLRVVPRYLDGTIVATSLFKDNGDFDQSRLIAHIFVREAEAALER